MTSEIYYFSGTGNSLTVARDIAARLEGKLIPVVSLINQEKIQTDADIMGIVFPVHNVVNGGVPPVIRGFLQRLEIIGPKYIFAVCTCGAGSGEALANVGKIIRSRGGKLAAGFTVKMPFNCPPFTKSEDQEKRFLEWRNKLGRICDLVISQKEGRIETAGALLKILTYPIGFIPRRLILNNYRKLAEASELSFDEAVLLIDRSHFSDDRCNGCGICAKVCPVNNIEIAEKDPSGSTTARTAWHALSGARTRQSTEGC